MPSDTQATIHAGLPGEGEPQRWESPNWPPAIIPDPVRRDNPEPVEPPVKPARESEPSSP